LHAQTGKKMEVQNNVPAIAHGGIHGTEKQAPAHPGNEPLAMGSMPLYLRGGESFLMSARSTKAERTPSPDGSDYLDATREFWQTRTDRPLSREDAREMAHNLLGFFSVLREWTLAERMRAEAPASSTETESPASRDGHAPKKVPPTEESEI
jgi:hypothetical protein